MRPGMPKDEDDDDKEWDGRQLLRPSACSFLALVAIYRQAGRGCDTTATELECCLLCGWMVGWMNVSYVPSC